MEKAKFNNFVKILGVFLLFIGVFILDSWLYNKRQDENKKIIETIEKSQTIDEQEPEQIISQNNQIKAEEKTINTDTKIVTSSLQIVPSTTIIYIKKPGYEFSFPSIFLNKEIAYGNLLASGYSFISNPSGIEGNSFIHNFSITILQYNLSLKESISREMPYVLPTSFPKASIESFVAQPGYSKVIKITGYMGIEYTEGAEGINMKTIFLKLGDNKTMVIKLKYIADILKPLISEARQLKIFEDFLTNLKIK